MTRLVPLAGASVLVAFGCRERVSLPDVPISGGSKEQRDAARQELRAFEGWIGSDRLEIAALEFKPLGGELFGKFYRAWDRVELEESLEVDRVRGALRHELCHALDHAEGLMSHAVPSFQTYGDLIYDRDDGVIDSRDSARDRRSEALAILCESGPLGAVALSEPCSGDPDRASAMFEFIAREVWREYDPAHPLQEPQATTAPYGPWDSFQVRPTASDERINLTTIEGGRESLRQLELGSGVPVQGEWADVAVSVTEVPAEVPTEGRVDSLVGWSDGPAGGLVQFSVVELGDFVERLVVFNEDRWDALPGSCVTADRAQRELFTADDQVWYASGDGDAISWTPIAD